MSSDRWPAIHSTKPGLGQVLFQEPLRDHPQSLSIAAVYTMYFFQLVIDSKVCFLKVAYSWILLFASKFNLAIAAFCLIV